MRWVLTVGLAGLLLFGIGLPAQASTVHVPCDVTHLRSAITAANTAPGSVLSLRRHCTYSITDVSSSPGDGLPAITASMTIRGNGARLVRSSTAQFRILEIDSGATVSITSLTIRGGHAPDGSMAAGESGGGILNVGTLLLRNVTILRNVSGNGSSGVGLAFNGGNGGGIENTGALTVVRSRVIGNSSGAGGGGLAITPGTGGTGGGIDDAGSLLLVASSIAKNRTGSGGSNSLTTGAGGNGAGLYVGSSGSAAIRRSVITRNFAATGGNGGGIFNDASTVITPRATRVVRNKPNNCAPANKVARCMH